MLPLNLHSIAFGFVAVFGFVVALFVLSIVLPGRTLQGVQLKDGTRISYKLNGFLLLLLTAAILLGGQFSGVIELASLVHHFWGLVVAANVLAFGATLWLYVRGVRAGDSHDDEEKPSVSGVSPSGEAVSAKPSVMSMVKGLYYGVTLNPSLFGIDIKMFSYRPSLIGLWVMNTSFAAYQYEQEGQLSTAMMLYQAFTSIYVLNYFQFEYGMLYTWDIVAEKFGWMLVWGDYAFVPFVYCIVGYYLPDREEPLSLLGTILLPLLFACGLWIFRGANQQKDEFKRDPSVKIWGKPAETIGGRILVSGFWGIGRKLNYTGEIMVYLSFTLLVGTTSVVPYLLPGWLISLLVHRAYRDDKKCREKYGALWEAYCAKAKFKMFPFVY